MRGIRIRRVRHIDGAELEVTSKLPAVSAVLLLIVAVPNVKRRTGNGCTVPCAVVIDILPEIEHVLTELIVVRRALIKRVAVVACHIHNLNVRAKRRIHLSCCIWINRCLQRHFRSHQICPRIRFRIPVFQINDTVAEHQRLVACNSRMVLIGPCIRRYCSCQRAKHRCGKNQRHDSG